MLCKKSGRPYFSQTSHFISVIVFFVHKSTFKFCNSLSRKFFLCELNQTLMCNQKIISTNRTINAISIYVYFGTESLPKGRRGIGIHPLSVLSKFSFLKIENMSLLILCFKFHACRMIQVIIFM